MPLLLSLKGNLSCSGFKFRKLGSLELEVGKMLQNSACLMHLEAAGSQNDYSPDRCRLFLIWEPRNESPSACNP